MPEYTDKTWQDSAQRIERGQVLADDYSQTNMAPYPVKSNGLPRGWRRSLDNETVYRKAHGWVMVVRVSRMGENGPFVLVGRNDGASQWFDWQGHRTLEDATAKADEVIG